MNSLIDFLTIPLIAIGVISVSAVFVVIILLCFYVTKTIMRDLRR